MSKPIILVGLGGHAGVLLDLIHLLGLEVIGGTDLEPNAKLGIVYLGGDHAIERHRAETVRLVNCLGSNRNPLPRKRLYERFKELGYSFATLVHPKAVIAKTAVLEEGVQVMAGTIVQPYAQIGRNTILNTRSSVDHDCLIGEHCHIAPGVSLSGNVTLGDCSHVGTGASVIQGVRLGPECLVAAGACVTRSYPESGTKLYGVPARPRSG